MQSRILAMRKKNEFVFVARAKERDAVRSVAATRERAIYKEVVTMRRQLLKSVRVGSQPPYTSGQKLPYSR